MYWLIIGSRADFGSEEETPSIRFQNVEIPEVVQTKEPPPPEPPPPPEEPPPPPEMEVEVMEQQPQQMPDLDMPDLDLSMSGTGPFMANMSRTERTGDGDFIPRVRIQPQYPTEAARNGIEGYVLLEFTVDVTGSVHRPRVVEARPPRVFDREALRAIQRWKFEPRVVDGQPIEATGRQRIDFTFDSES